MDVGIALLVALISYLLGSISFTRVVGRIVAPGEDLTRVSMAASQTDTVGHQLNSASATTASVKLGPKVGCTIGLLDILKTFLPVLVSRLLFPEQPYLLVAAVMGMAGHNWPVFYRFRGGRGMSPYVGGLLAIDPLGALITNAIGLSLGMFIFRDMVVAYLSGMALLIPWMIFTTGDWRFILYSLLINVLFGLGMIPDIQQIIEAKKRPEYQNANNDLRMQNAMEIMPMGRGMMKIMNAIQPHRKTDGSPIETRDNE